MGNEAHSNNQHGLTNTFILQYFSNKYQIQDAKL